MRPADEIADAIILRFPKQPEPPKEPIVCWPSVWARTRLLVEAAGWLVIIWGFSTTLI